MRISIMFALATSLLLATACSDDDGDDGDDGDDIADDGDDGDDAPACADIAGTWDIDGQCGNDTCTIGQVNCDITQVICTSGAMSTSGDVSGNAFSYTGTSGGGVPSTCSGTVNGNSMSGSCTIPASPPCTFTGTR